MDHTPLKICIAGAGGIPGRNILSSLLPDSPFKHLTTVLKRALPGAVQQSDDRLYHYQTTSVDFNDRSNLIQVIWNLKPNVLVSALNAEPGPILDTNLVNLVVSVLR